MKIGDEIEIVSFGSNGYTGSYPCQKGKIINICHSNEPAWYVCVTDNSNLSIYQKHLKLINTKNMQNLNIKDIFKLAFKGEPEKSFIKAGITGNDDFLTDDGLKIFLSWLLKQNGTQFKTEVVDGILAEMDKENK